MMAVRMGALHLALLFLFLFLVSASTQRQQGGCPAPFVMDLYDKQALYNQSGGLLAPIPPSTSLLSTSEILFLTDKELLASPIFTRDIPLLADPLKIVANINTLAHNLWGPNGENLVAFLLTHPHVIIVGGAVMHAASTHPTRGKGTSDIDMGVYAEEEEVLYETLRAFVASFTLLEGGRRRKIVIDRTNTVLNISVEGCEELMIQIVNQGNPDVILERSDDIHGRKDARTGLNRFLTSVWMKSDAPLTMMGISARAREGEGNDKQQEQRELMFQASVESLYGMETGLVRYWQTKRWKGVSFTSAHA
jgi:hypothetical protein